VKAKAAANKIVIFLQRDFDGTKIAVKRGIDINN